MENIDNKENVTRRGFISKSGMAVAALGLSPLVNANSLSSGRLTNSKPKSQKVVIITGSSRGIGAAIARKLGTEGYKVVVNCKEERDLAAEVVKDIKKDGGEAVWLQADVREPKMVSKLFDLAQETYGGVDIVINNAGVMKLSTFAEMTDEDYDYIIDTNIKGGFNVLREASKKVRDGGRIISISSSITELKTATYGPYAASKAALQIFSSALAKELAGRNISVNALAPGVVNTPLFTDGKSKELIQMFAQRTPHGRIGEPEDIAEVISSLCSSYSYWVNGQTIFANGGLI